ncbi:MAG: cell division protein FtsL [Bacteroidaceae bacterium]|nr:cell division protein FtsL [Bacteroidaceae bacterium]
MVPIRWIRNHKYLFVTAVFLVIVLLFDEKSMMKHIENQNKIDSLKKEISIMQRDSMDIETRNAGLENKEQNEDVEKLAREKYGMHTPQEEVYVIE